MADDVDQQPYTEYPFSSSKASIFKTFSEIRRWREEQNEQFRKMQMLESEKLLSKSQESQKLFKQLLEKTGESVAKIPDNVSPTKTVSETNNSISESSITGHLLNCFSDTSICPTLNESNNMFKDVISPSQLVGKVQNLIVTSQKSHSKEQEIFGSMATAKKPCRPFLKKGSGLARYLPKTTKKECTKSTKKRDAPKVAKVKQPYPRAQQRLKLIRSELVPSEKSKHIRFEDQDPEMVLEESPSKESQLQENVTELIGKSAGDEIKNGNDYDVINLEEKSLLDEKNTTTESMNLERNELAEFELLENCAQNSSFNSESSLVQRVIHGEKRNSSSSSPCHLNSNSVDKISNFLQSAQANVLNINCPEIVAEKSDLSKCLSVVQTRKQQLQQMISDINPRIASLQKEINGNKVIFEEEEGDMSSERCSTPIVDSNPEEKMLENLDEYCQNNLSFESVNRQTDKDFVTLPNESSNNLLGNDILEESEPEIKQNNLEQKVIFNNANQLDTAAPPDKSQTSGPLKLKEKFLELEKEIGIYQELNAKLSDICKEREDIVKKLRKEQEDFKKHMEEERKKLKLEQEENQRQMKRQKETFLRHQKLRQDNPFKKEREGMAVLRQEVSTLLEDLRRLKIKYNNDTKKLKNQLINMEKDKESFRVENIRLDEQCKDLLQSLKDINKKWKQAIASKKFKDLNVSDPPEKDPEHVDQRLEKLQNEDLCDVIIKRTSMLKPVMKHNELISKQSITKPKVHFDSQPKYKLLIQNEDSESENDCDDNLGTNVIEDPSDSETDVNDQQVAATENDVGNHDDDAFCDSEPELVEKKPYIEIKHENKVERIYDSGEREFLYPSGTVKHINSEKNCVKFFFINGDSKEVYPDKKIYKFANGVIETNFPDGLEVTEFPNGQSQKIYPDGKREVKYVDGTTHILHSNGSEEIRTSESIVIILDIDGTETIEFTNGQREIRTATYKRREYPDGSVKTIYESGRQETRFANGRIRIKDKEGKLIVDTKRLKEIPKI